jgi:hypothetical protein
LFGILLRPGRIDLERRRRRSVRSTDDGHHARILTTFWADEGRKWDWLNRTVYLAKAP